MTHEQSLEPVCRSRDSCKAFQCNWDGMLLNLAQLSRWAANTLHQAYPADYSGHCLCPCLSACPAIESLPPGQMPAEGAMRQAITSVIYRVQPHCGSRRQTQLHQSRPDCSAVLGRLQAGSMQGCSTCQLLGQQPPLKATRCGNCTGGLTLPHSALSISSWGN